MEEVAKLFVELQTAVPSWGVFRVTRLDNLYQIYISIKSSFGLKPFKVTTESTSLAGALKQSLNVLNYYWKEKEEESEVINNLIKELKQEGIIEEDEDEYVNEIEKGLQDAKEGRVERVDDLDTFLDQL